MSNRVIIIGNGFDLALGLKTSFKDFLLWDLKESLIELIDKGTENNFWNLKNIRNTQHTGVARTIKDQILSRDSIQSTIRLVERYISVNLNTFSEAIISELNDKGWVDIEQYYYFSLLSELNKLEKTDRISRKYHSFDSVQKQTRYLMNRLHQYILIVESSFDFGVKHIPISDFLFDIIDQVISVNNPGRVLFLNFNYTSTVNQIILRSSSVPDSHTYMPKGVSYINIHGKVKNGKDDIIFGFGNDRDLSYKKLEQENVDSLLEHMKSIRYTLSSSYSELLDFLEDNAFDVHIIGHSAGLSDGTLLQTVFTHKNCIGIHAYHRGDIREFHQKSIAISRHFEDKSLYLKRLKSFNPENKIPQV